jgi:hypothetical protein
MNWTFSLSTGAASSLALTNSISLAHQFFHISERFGGSRMAVNEIWDE